jgi:hypothetical protein
MNTLNNESGRSGGSTVQLFLECMCEEVLVLYRGSGIVWSRRCQRTHLCLSRMYQEFMNA